MYNKLILVFLSMFNQAVVSSYVDRSCELYEGISVRTCDPVEGIHIDSEEYDLCVKNEIEKALNESVPCENSNCVCHERVIYDDLKPFKGGITKDMFESVISKGTKYQIINSKVYRSEKCHFPARCSGIEHYLTLLASELPDMEMVINTRDWPQLLKVTKKPAPIFSFSKTSDYYDIMYPAWSFWEGGPAIPIYPTGIGRWDKTRKSLINTAMKWPWSEKRSVAFFRGSRTNRERDALVLLSRARPDLADAQYTKNQAWKSSADTLHAPPAAEVTFEEHCRYKQLVNYRGVAASFRLKHLFLCNSLVLNAGAGWQEFFYPSLVPWVHYVPLCEPSEGSLGRVIDYFRRHDGAARAMARRGFRHVHDTLRDRDVRCYWRRLLTAYAALLTYKVERDRELVLIQR